MIRRRDPKDLASHLEKPVLLVMNDGNLSIEHSYYVSLRRGGFYFVTVLYGSDDWEIPLDRIKYWYDLEDIKTLLNLHTL